MPNTPPDRTTRRRCALILAAAGGATLLAAEPAAADSLDAVGNGELGETVAINTLWLTHLELPRAADVRHLLCLEAGRSRMKNVGTLVPKALVSMAVAGIAYYAFVLMIHGARRPGRILGAYFTTRRTVDIGMVCNDLTAGLAMMSDDLPLVGPSERPGLWLCCGWSGSGFTTGAAVGATVATWPAGDEPPGSSRRCIRRARRPPSPAAASRSLHRGAAPAEVPTEAPRGCSLRTRSQHTSGRCVVNARMKIAVAVAVTGAVAVAGSAAMAGGGKELKAGLNGYQEVPAFSTTGSGTFRASVAGSGDAISYKLSYAGIEGTVTQAHIHFGQRNVSGGISVFLCSNLGNGPAGTQACPAPPATIEGTIHAADVIGPAVQGIAPGELGELMNAIRAGLTYANVHSSKAPSGEVRGQIRPGWHEGGGPGGRDDDR